MAKSIRRVKTEKYECHHQKRIAVDRNCLTRSEHEEMLSTPKGHTWRGGPRGLTYVRKRCKNNPPKVRRPNTDAQDSSAMWQKFIQKFLLNAEDSLNPATKITLIKILNSKTNSDPKWPNITNTQTDLCRFFHDLNLNCSSNKWKTYFVNTLSSMIFNYIVQVVCSKRKTKNKRLTRIILKTIINITQENGLLNTPGNFLQGVQTFIAKMLSPWLEKPVADICQKTNKELKVQSKINIETRKHKSNKQNKESFGKFKNNLQRNGNKHNVKNIKKINTRVKERTSANAYKKRRVVGKSKRPNETGHSVDIKFGDGKNKNNHHSKANSLSIKNTHKIKTANKIKTKLKSKKDMRKSTIKHSSTKKRAKTSKKTIAKLKTKKSTKKTTKKSSLVKKMSTEKVQKIHDMTTDSAKNSVGNDLINKNDEGEKLKEPKSNTVANNSDADRKLSIENKRKTIQSDENESTKKITHNMESETEIKNIDTSEDNNKTGVKHNSSNETTNVNKGQSTVDETDVKFNSNKENLKENENRSAVDETDVKSNSNKENLNENEKRSTVDETDIKFNSNKDNLNENENRSAVVNHENNNSTQLNNSNVFGSNLDTNNVESTSKSIKSKIDIRISTTDNDGLDVTNQKLENGYTTLSCEKLLENDQDELRTSSLDTNSNQFETCDLNDTNNFVSKKPEIVEQTEACGSKDESHEPKGSCTQRFTHMAQRMLDENSNKDMSLKCNQNPGIIYHIHKKDGSNYSLHKTILPSREKNDTASNQTGKTQLLARTTKEVDSWNFDFGKNICVNRKINPTCLDDKLDNTSSTKIKIDDSTKSNGK